jgi:hypothetical protein
MSLSNYQLPPDPSPQLQVVLDYFKYLSRWDFDKLSSLSSPRFTQETLPASLGTPSRTNSKDIAFLKEIRDSLKSAPLQVGQMNVVPLADRRTRRFKYTILTSPRVEFGSTYAPSLSLSRVLAQKMAESDCVALAQILMNPPMASASSYSGLALAMRKPSSSTSLSLLTAKCSRK